MSRKPNPAFIYGTAWKEAETRRLTRLALVNGFRAIDTANQRRHYHEAAVGEALAQVLAGGRLAREDLFVQSKFTHIPGQDHRLPYDRHAETATQVRQSLVSSLAHLGVDHLDCYLLHGPSSWFGIGSADLEAWRAMEELQEAGKTKLLGVSNFNAEQLELLCESATVAPEVVQNRCHASQGWDREVRALCRDRGIAYQAFSLLTANRRELDSAYLRSLAERLGRTPAQVVFRFAQQVGMIPLTGTSSPEHMREDLACADFDLSSEDLHLIDRIAS